MKKIILILASIIVLFSCKSDTNINQSISGNIKNATEGSQIILAHMSASALTNKDTAQIDNQGNYSFKKPIETLAYYRLKINDQNFINLILDKGETPTINGDANNFDETYSVEGSEESLRLKRINTIYKKNNMVNDSLNKVFQANPGDPNLMAQLQQKAFEAANSMNNSLIEIVNKKPASLASLAVTDLLNPDENFETFKKIDDAFSKEMPDSDYFKKFHQKVMSLKQLAIGSIAPEIALEDQNGKTITLSSLKGNVVLIDFWASWCRPCRAENPNVVNAFNKYNKDGFEVFSVSLDGLPQQQNAKQAWIDAIEKDNLTWKSHVSDLQGWNSSVVPLYGFKGIPFTVLLDQDGKIIGKNIRGQALQQKLAEIFES